MPVVPLDGWWPWVDKEEASSDNCFLASSEEVEEVEEVVEEEEEEEKGSGAGGEWRLIAKAQFQKVKAHFQKYM